jgi:zinc protease
MKPASAFLAFSLALVWTAPAFAQAAAAPPVAPPKLELSYTQFTLPNGLTVILHEDHTVPVISTNMWYHVGSAREKTGRTGFAHLFEHLMFMGSQHVKPGEFDDLLERSGGTNNGSTENDRTNYWINLPSNALELALFLESDRMGYLLESMTPKTVDAQRDVVKNERRQSYENRPYGQAELTLGEMLYPEGHPYHWPVIGYMPDLTAASYDDVVEFFKKYYGPGNASLVVAGDFETAKAKALVEKWFGDVKNGASVEPITVPGVQLNGVQKKTLTDKVQLQRLYVAWLTPPHFAPGDAALDMVADTLSGGKNSRLYKRLVYDMQIAQEVSAYQASQALSSYFLIEATARPGHTADELLKVIDEEVAKLQNEAPSAHDVERSLNQIESSFYSRMERVGGFGGKADQLNAYFTATGDPDYFNEDLGRYRALSPSDIRAAAIRFLPKNARVELTVVPEGAK